MKTTRRQRALYLAATQNIEEIGPDTHKVRGYTVNGSCDCVDWTYRPKNRRHRKTEKCKHMQAVDFLQDYGRPSLILAMLMAAGGGEIVTTRRGGIGWYERLEGNTLLGRPIAIAEVDNVLYPAAIYHDHVGDYLLPLTRAALSKRFAPDLHELSKRTLMSLYEALQKQHKPKISVQKTQPLPSIVVPDTIPF